MRAEWSEASIARRLWVLVIGAALGVVLTIQRAAVDIADRAGV